MTYYLETRVVKIRTPRHCYGCASLFKKGELMTVATSIDIVFLHNYWCKSCEDWLSENHEVGDEYSYGELSEYVNSL